MNSFVILIVLSFVLNSEGIRLNEDLQPLFNYIKDNMSPYKVNMLAKSFVGLSPLADGFVRKINKNFVSSNIEFGNMSRTRRRTLTTEQIWKVHARYIPERVSLTMGLIESRNESSALREMESMLNIVASTWHYIRGKWFILLITEEIQMNLQNFLRKAWSKKFLDLTVIRCIRTNQTEHVIVGSSPIMASKNLVHTFNPFNNSFNTDTLTGNTDLLPEKVESLNGSPLIGFLWSFSLPFLTMKNESSGIVYEGTDLSLMNMLMEAMNFTFLIKTKETSSAVGPNRKVEEVYDLILAFYYSPTIDPTERWESSFISNLKVIPIPVHGAFHLLLMRPKIYEIDISMAAIVTFRGLFFTAWIFAMWAYLLGFKEKNWSFLNILTVQMGGSIEHQGRMKLSEMIFQMSIYIATFIVVTLGADHMFQIFVLHQELPDIKTLQDLADSRIDLAMDDYQYAFLKTMPRDTLLEKIFDRIKQQNVTEGSHTFCRAPSSNFSIFDYGINFGISYSRFNEHLMKSNDSWQIDKIQDPMFVFMPQVKLRETHAFFKDRLQKLINRFSEVGLLRKWEMDNLRYQKSFGKFSLLINDGDGKNEELTLKDQLWPILMVGYSVGIFALVAEFIWKRWIAKTEFGRLARAFYSDSQSNSADQRVRMRMNCPGETSTRMKTSPNLSMRTNLRAAELSPLKRRIPLMQPLLDSLAVSGVVVGNEDVDNVDDRFAKSARYLTLEKSQGSPCSDCIVVVHHERELE